VRPVIGAVEVVRDIRKADDIDRAVLKALAAGPLFGPAVRVAVQRRAKDVNAALSRLAGAGRVTGGARKPWSIVQ
jgi:hypothetical protein